MYQPATGVLHLLLEEITCACDPLVPGLLGGLWVSGAAQTEPEGYQDPQSRPETSFKNALCIYGSPVPRQPLTPMLGTGCIMLLIKFYLLFCEWVIPSAFSWLEVLKVPKVWRWNSFLNSLLLPLGPPLLVTRVTCFWYTHSVVLIKNTRCICVSPVPVFIQMSDYCIHGSASSNTFFGCCC